MNTQIYIDHSDTILEGVPLSMRLLPDWIWCNWFNYKGETYFGSPIQGKNGHIYIELSYCATRHLNNNIIKTVRWKKEYFTRCNLTDK